MKIEIVEGRPLYPAVCSCVHGCRSREEMRKLHGDLDAFALALSKAFAAGDISLGEARRANHRYRAEWREAPEKI